MDKTFSLLKKIGEEIKYSVVITDLIMTLYCLWLIITNTSSWIPGALFGYTPFVILLLLKANKLFKFCLIHRLMLLHTGAVYCCCMYQAYYGFEEYLGLFRQIMFLSGLYLIVSLIVKRCKCYDRGR